MKVSIVIPTHRPVTELLAVKSLAQQKTKDFEVLVLHQGEFTPTQAKTYQKGLPDWYRLVTHLDGYFRARCGVSALRNRWARLATTGFLCFVDDDNEFGSEFVQTMLDQYHALSKKYGKDILLVPTETRSDGEIHVSAYRDFNFLLVRQLRAPLVETHPTRVKLASSNCLAGPRSIFQFVQFDEGMPFVFEDLDFTYRARLSGFSLFYCPHWRLIHRQRPKTTLQEVYLGDTASAYQKGKNRTQFVNKVANFWERVQYRGFGLWGNTIFMLLRIMIRGWDRRRPLAKAFIKGTGDGIQKGARDEETIYW